MNVRSTVWFFASIAALAIATTPVDAQSILWKTLFDSGNDALAHGDLAQAERQLEAALKDASQSQSKGEPAPHLARTMRALADVLSRQGKFKRAEELYQSAMTKDEEGNGADSLAVANDLTELAHLYRRQERYSEAEPLYKKSVEILIKAKGPDSAEVADNLRFMALLYQDQSQYALAESLFERAQSVYKKEARQSSRLADCLSDLAALYALRNETSKAIPLYDQALKIRESLFGADSPETADSLDELGQFYSRQDDEKCLEYFKRAEKIQRRGTTTGDTMLAMTLADHADFLAADQRFSEARPLYEESLKLVEQREGSEDKAVAVSLVKLAGCLENLNLYDQAESLLKRALSIDSKASGEDSYQAAKDMADLAFLNFSLGRYAVAEPLYEKSLKLISDHGGEKHPNTATAMNSLALLYLQERRYPDADRLLKSALSIREEVFGQEHPLVAQSLSNLADSCLEQQRYSEAETLLRRSLSIETKALGDEHPNVAKIRQKLADLLSREGKNQDARAIYQTLLKRDREKGDDPAVAQDLLSLASLEEGLGNASQARNYRDQAAAITKTMPGGLYQAQPSIIARTPTERVPGSAAATGSKWALVIGISSFKDSAINLKYPAKDAVDFANFLVQNENFQRDHIRLLINENATRDNIVSALGDSWLGSKAKVDDLVVIYLSTHGSSAQSSVGGQNFIVSYETNLKNLVLTGIPMQSLTAGLKEMLQCRRVLIFLDVCHAGAISKATETSLLRNRARSPSPLQLASFAEPYGEESRRAAVMAALDSGKGLIRVNNPNVRDVRLGDGEIVIASSEADQISWESLNYPNGVFTHQLIEALKAKPNLSAAYAYMKEKVYEEVLRDRGAQQRPVLIKQWAGPEPDLARPSSN